MKKLTAFLVCLIIFSLNGCKPNSNIGGSSSYKNNTDLIDSVISNIEQDISEREQAGEITVTVEQEIISGSEYQDTLPDQAGKQNAVIDSDLNTKDIITVEPADVNTKGEKPLYYTYLTDIQKQIYKYMKTAAEQMTTGLFSIGAVRDGENRFSDIAVSFRALSADNPQLFWLPNSYILSPDGSSLAFSYAAKGADYLMSAEQKRQAQIRLTATLNSLVSQANKLSSRFEKELFFHDWLCQNVTYRDDGTENIYTAYGALINGSAVCEGYSRAMQLLCDSVGIPCTVVYGSSRGVGHMWNIVDAGDGWCHLDVTWDDDEKYNFIRHSYFNLTDSQILTDHSIFDTVKDGKHYVGSDDFNIRIFDCNSDTYNYFTKNNLIFDNDYSADAQMISAAAQSGKTSIEVFYSGNNYDAFLQQVNIALSESKATVQINSYSYLGGSLVLWW